jgi:hypothetical protein
VEPREIRFPDQERESSINLRLDLFGAPYKIFIAHGQAPRVTQETTARSTPLFPDAKVNPVTFRIACVAADHDVARVTDHVDHPEIPIEAQ